MLSKTDIRLIQDIFRSEIDPLKKSIQDIKSDTTDIKVKINDFAKFTIDAISNLVEWIDEIHNTLIKEKLPERVRHLEQIIKTS